MFQIDQRVSCRTVLELEESEGLVVLRVLYEKCHQCAGQERTKCRYKLYIIHPKQLFTLI